jgi:ribose transport system permease protein
VVFVLALLVLRYTGYGRMLYAVGGNAEAARLAGINVTFVRVSVFGISAGLAGLAAVMDTARLTTASPVAGSGYELLAGAAVLLGGTSFMGGRGSVFGTLLGVLFLGVLQNGLTLAGISPFWAAVASGVVLIAAVLVDRLRNGAMRS